MFVSGATIGKTPHEMPRVKSENIQIYNILENTYKKLTEHLCGDQVLYLGQCHI